ncbi:PLP-dependent transferase [Auriscalpium vulgare]|uniref:PLP-dependent transferase n=1 Tax=Auriscalpium vulgare TaxID=40419 RepID=A0ACB8RXZ8_9AGAM|nr:PLP-dependent transferase [Auriscalpium vulgare]
MSLLFKQLRIHQVFGANTDVGKTILTSALVRASAAAQHKVFYLKPVSTGPMQDADDEHVKRYAGAHGGLVDAHCLYRFDEPLSPHLAAKMAAEKSGLQDAEVPSDSTFVAAVASHIRRSASSVTQKAHMYVETAGGVHSPTLSGTTQLDAYRPLFLPTILVGDSRLGGISSTIASYEALQLRGYAVDSILLFRDEYYRNWEYLTPYFAERGVRVDALDPPPPRDADEEKNFNLTEEYYTAVVPEAGGGLFEIVRHLDDCHARRLAELESMPARTLDTIWWPFVQHGLVKGPADVNVIDSAWGDYFTVFNGHTAPARATPASLLEPQLDGSASWWTQALGHAHPALTLAAARAAGRYGHVMFPQATHLPALKLAERLVKDGPGKGWAARAFISDNGSTGMEVALKMALRAYSVRHGDELAPGERKKMGVLGLKGSYHGDTIGAMDACEEGVYTCEWHDAKGFWFDPPTVAIRDGRTVISLPPSLAEDDRAGAMEADSLAWVYNVPGRLDTPLAERYRAFIRTTLQKLEARGGPPLGALVLEPLVMGAGGMLFVDPLFQRVLIDVVRSRGTARDPSSWSGMPVIFDEVFVGLYRIGMQSTAPLLGVAPDISVHAKILTGGLLPLAVTLASDAVFRAFEGESKATALLHGHSYTAHAVGCEVANETLDVVERLASGDAWTSAREAWGGSEGHAVGVWSFWDPAFLDVVSKASVVDDVMTLGTVLAIRLKDVDAGYQSHSAQTLLKSLNTSIASEEGTAAPGGAPFSIHFRTLGNLAYFMTSLNTPAATVRAVEDRIWAVLDRAGA